MSAGRARPTFKRGGLWSVRQALTSRGPYISERELPLTGTVVPDTRRPPGLPGHQGWKTATGAFGPAALSVLKSSLTLRARGRACGSCGPEAFALSSLALRARGRGFFSSCLTFVRSVLADAAGARSRLRTRCVRFPGFSPTLRAEGASGGRRDAPWVAPC